MSWRRRAQRLTRLREPAIALLLRHPALSHQVLHDCRAERHGRLVVRRDLAFRKIGHDGAHARFLGDVAGEASERVALAGRGVLLQAAEHAHVVVLDAGGARSLNPESVGSGKKRMDQWRTSISSGSASSRMPWTLRRLKTSSTSRCLCFAPCA